jgi:hypothetical protein
MGFQFPICAHCVCSPSHKRIFVVANQFFSETMYLQALQHVGTELQTVRLVFIG